MKYENEGKKNKEKLRLATSKLLNKYPNGQCHWHKENKVPIDAKKNETNIYSSLRNKCPRINDN